MSILYFFEGLRTPVLDSFFSAVTHLGEETIFIVVGLLLFWCINKKQGYFVLAVGLMGTVINQFLKMAFRIPRPWVRDPEFTIVESARAEATGYSFPSGHTQAAVGVFGSIARMVKKTWVRVACIVICVLVPLSRMYLGVHTPADVGVSTVVALVLIFVLYPVVNRAVENKRQMRMLMLLMAAVAAANLLFVSLYPFPADVDVENLAHGVSSAWKMLGCILGLWVAYEVDEKYTHFETKAVWWAQGLKLVIGLVPILAIKAGLKAPLQALFAGAPLADGIRYFLLVVAAGAVWPLTFRWFAKLGKKK